MKIIVSILLLFFSYVISKKELITVKTERAEVIKFNPKLANINIKAFKYNRTITTINSTLTLKVPIIPGYKVAIQAYKFASNEYRQFPVTFDAEICSSFRTNYFGMQNLANCGNFTFDCPIRPGIYDICNWIPDYHRFPPHLVTGQFMVEIRAIFRTEEAFSFNWYIVVADEMIIYEN